MSPATEVVTESARDELRAGMPVAERTVVAAALDTAVLEGGDGPPLLLLHGPGESCWVWLPVLSDLVRTHRVVAADLPGHGASGMPTEGLRRDWFDSWLDELISATCAAPPVLVGRVVGGAIAAYFAAAHPDRLTHLVLVDTMGLEAFHPDPRFGLAMNRFLASPSLGSYERFMEFCAFDLDTARNHFGRRWSPFARYAVQLASDPRVQSAIGSVIGLYAGSPIPADTLNRIEVPTALIWGRHDAATSLSVAEVAAARYDRPLHIIDGAGDDPALDRPVEFVDTLAKVLSGEKPRS